MTAPCCDIAPNGRGCRCLHLGLSIRFSEEPLLRLICNRLAGFAGRGLVANTDVAIAHDGYPLLKRDNNAQRTHKVARHDASWHGWFDVSGLFSRERLKTSPRRTRSGRLIRLWRSDASPQLLLPVFADRPVAGRRRSRHAGVGLLRSPVVTPIWWPMAMDRSLVQDELGSGRASDIEIIGFFAPMFRPSTADETILLCHETIFRFWRRYPETAVGYHVANETAGTPAPKPETARCGPSASSSPSPSSWLAPRWRVRRIRVLPGIGTFSYNGSPVTNSGSSRSCVVAAN